MAAALEADRVNAIFVVEPFLAQAKSKGWRSIGSFAEIEPGLCVAVYFTSKQVAQSNPDLVKRYSEALRESLAYAETHPDEVRAILGTYTKINEDVRKQMVLRWPAEINKASLARPGAHRGLD
jgi:NitT/TauT family transport system substrate-binding protein